MVNVENVSKKYCRTLKKSMLYGIFDIGRNMCGLSSHADRLRKEEFWAIDNISFEIKKGDSLGLIGPNGSGKTTLLKMLNGIFWPDKGKISLKGRMGALISVGAGFHPLLTGRENIYVNGAILGMSKREVVKSFDSIVEFADIGNFLDAPVKHYSSGMFVRLGFAVAVHCEPDILLVDEVLAVGDMNFQTKCIERMEELTKQGVTKIFVSHDMTAVNRICKKALYISSGKIRGFGETGLITEQYRKEVITDMQQDRGKSKTHKPQYGTGDIIIAKVEIMGVNNEIKHTFARGDCFKIRISFRANKAVASPEFVIKFYSDDGVLVSQPNTKDHKVALDKISGSGELEYSVSELLLNQGHYFLTIAIWDSAGYLPHDVHEKLYDFIVTDATSQKVITERAGLVYWPSQWKWHLSN